MKRFLQMLSMVLVICMLCNMLPAQSFAAQISAGDNAQLITPEDASTEKSTARVIGEVTENRTEYSKEFLLSDGSTVAAVYAEPVHYEKDGAWQDIDNTLKLTDGTYENTAGAWSVSLPQTVSQTAPIRVTKDGHTLSFTMSGELRQQGNLEVASVQAVESAAVTIDGSTQTFAVQSAQTVTGQVQTIDTTARKQAAEHAETVLDNRASALQYNSVYPGTHLRYDLHGSTLKESVILQSYSSTLRGYRYTLSTGDLLPVVNEDGSIYFLDSEKNIHFVMKAPYLMDDAEQCSYDIRVSLTGGNGTYTLTYLLPTAWLADASRAWPVVLDPAVTTKPSVLNTRDQTVAENTTYDYERPVLECGYGSNAGKQRIFLKYKTLPTLTSSDVIVEARITLYKPENSDSIVTVDVHKVLKTWESESLTWDNKPEYNSIVEDYALINPSGYYAWDVTDIVRGWYSGENTGMMFKASDQYETGGASTWKQFASSDNGASSWMPSLVIVYRNNNGIEDYWDYTASSAGRAGTGYVNSYTGNLAWIRSDMGFGGNRMPVTISHVYNLNDSAANAFGMGYGWRTNFNQLAYIWEDDTNYYIWEDADGTLHYFKRQSDGTYKDEDGLELTLTVSGTTKIITNKNGEKHYFNSDGRLYKQENNQKTKSSIDISYTDDGKIDYVTDGAGRKYDFTYTDGLLSEIEYLGSGTEPLATTRFTYASGNLNYITDSDGKYCNYTYYGRALRYVVDVDGYRVTYAYNTPNGTHQPYRVQSITESDSGTNGGSLSIQYDHNQTTFTDALGNKQILQFNNWGNVTCIQDDEGHAQYAQYALDNDSANAKGNQLVKASKLQNTVGNVLKYNSFESGVTWGANPAGSATVTNTTAEAYIGNRSQCFTMSDSATGWGCISSDVFTIKAGETYTFSAYVKGVKGTSYLYLVNRTDFSGAVTKATEGATGWTRVEITCTNNTGADSPYRAQFYADPGSQAYIDCVQVEKMPTASRYNLVENGDFWYTNAWSSSSARYGCSESPAPTLQNTAYKLFSNARGTNRLSQTVAVNGVKDDTFVLGGWAMGNSARIYEDDDLPEDQNKREFAIYGTFNYTDGTTSKAFIARFNPDADQWQYAAQVMVAEKAYSSIKVELVYDYNVNSAYFDGIQLYKEEFGNSYTYDKDGNVISVVDLQKQKTTYEYTDNDLTKEILPTGAELTYTYDDYHNVTKATTEEGQVYEFTYDAWGNNTSVSIVNGSSKITSTATYSTDGNRLLSTTDALGKVTTYDYDPDTNVLNWVQYPEDGDGKDGTKDTRTHYRYEDDLYRLTSVVATTDTGLSLSASYTYENDLLKTIATPTTTYSFEHGAFGLRSAVSIGNQALATYTYEDVTNLLTKLEYGNGDRVEYTYDTKGRLLTQTYEDGDTVAYKYDNNGALATVTDSATGIKTTYYYDFTDRMMKYVESGTNYSHSVGYEYDNINNLTATVETINGVDRSTSYTYDKDNRVKTKQTGSAKVTYTYDSFGRIEKQVTTNNGTTVLTETFTYNGNSSQIRTYTTTAGGKTTFYRYTYDDNGNITSINDGTYTTTYHYDSANQLIREDNEAYGCTYTWTYDDAGNIISNGIGNCTTGEPNDDFIISYSYSNGDWGDLLTSYSDYVITYDEIGNPVRMQDEGEMIGWTYTWQHGRQLASATYAEVWAPEEAVTWNFTYNTDGLRTKRTDGTTTYSYVYNGSQLTAMTVGTDVLYFSYDAAGTPMSVNYKGTEYYYTSNIQGDVTGIVNSSGETVVTYTYDAWGNILSCTGSDAATLGTMNPLRYRGYVYDQETGLYYLQSRYYDPQIGRFINGDNYPTTGQGFSGNNMFAYCGNNPVFRVDDEGEFWHIVVGAVTGALIGGVAKAVSNAIEGKSLTDGLATAMLAGAASGALASTGVGIVGMVAGNTAISMAENAANQVLENKGFNNFDVGDMLFDGAIGGISGALGGAGKGTKHLTNLGKQTVKRTLNATIHGGLKAGFKEAGKAFAYYGKNSVKYYKTFIKGLPSDFISAVGTAIASSSCAKNQYRRILER